jgi:hypothetical protein
VLAHDAVRLPCAVVLPTSSAEVPLTRLADSAGDVLVGDGCLTWTGAAGRVVVRAVREWAPAMVRPGSHAAGDFAELLDAMPGPGELPGWEPLLTMLTTEPAAAVAGLLGRGPGLTPAGDDMLAGFLLGARAFGLDVPEARAAVAAMAPARTTGLSAALLWHAARGECVEEVAAVLTDPSGPAMAALLRVGHTSGAALAAGLWTAALAALDAGQAGEAA